jgi:hypothetical protein
VARRTQTARCTGDPACIDDIARLLIVYFSCRQTIAATRGGRQ